MRYITFVLSILFLNSFHCQDLSLQGLGNAAFEKGNYREALHYYKAIEQKQLFFRRRNFNYLDIAACYQYLLVPDSVALYYIKYYRTNRKIKQPLLDAAENYKMAANQPKAIKYYKKYSKKGWNYYYAQQQIHSFDITNNWDANLVKFSALLESQLSSKFYDFSPCFLDDDHSLIFSSSRFETHPDLNLGNNFGFYHTTKAANKWSKPIRIDTTAETFNSAVVSIDNKRNVLFLTKCDQNTTKNEGCVIHYTFLDGNLIGETFEVPLRENHETNTVYAHPSFSNELEVLFFVSDREGGFGGKDIWYSKYDRDKDNWGEPVNMGAGINTSEDELFPYISDDGSFYYSSKGGITMGGLDLFRAEMSTPFKWGKGTNMQHPFNSTFDDFGIIFNQSNTAGYFTSNRKGGLGYDDIYSFTKKNVHPQETRETPTSNASILKSVEEVFNRPACDAFDEPSFLTNFKLYPNPNNGAFSIEFNSNSQKDIKVRVFNTSGTVIYSKLLITDKLTKVKIDISENVSGVYYVQLLDKCLPIYSTKLIKQN